MPLLPLPLLVVDAVPALPLLPLPLTPPRSPFMDSVVDLASPALLLALLEPASSSTTVSYLVRSLTRAWVYSTFDTDFFLRLLPVPELKHRVQLVDRVVGGASQGRLIQSKPLAGSHHGLALLPRISGILRSFFWGVGYSLPGLIL